jgi:malate dehydrogenase (oxaloacetate-decarboxylating)(NADP+)
MARETYREISEDTIRPSITGFDLIHDPILNKGTGFTEEERRHLGLEGLLPPRVADMQEQILRVLENYRKKPTDLEKYIYLVALQDRNETLFYRVVLDNLVELMPIIYTPVVGKACQLYGHIFRRPRGIFLARKHRGSMRHVLRNWPAPDVRVIVVTDGERILGLGDLGANGMGIPVGKLSLYTACAGVDPGRTLPVTLDVGTNNAELLADPLYLGTRERRLTGAAYDDFVDEFVAAVQDVYPGALIQFEDFANHHAFRLLERYRDRICCFNDDVQGTAAVALAGLYSALRITGRKLTEQKILFHGAGEAAVGIGNLTVAALTAEGLSRSEAVRRCWFCDSRGLVVAGRTDLEPHKRPFAHEHQELRDLPRIIRALEPTMLCGVSGHPDQFTREVLEELARVNERPIVFALSNPTSQAECTAEQAYAWTAGRAVFASGSPFPPVAFEGRTYVPGQGNNAYVFPGVGLGAVVCGARRINDEMFFEAARVLASLVSEEDLAQGCIYPSLSGIREVSARIAAAVCEVAYRRGLATASRPDDLLARIRAVQYRPVYKTYV